MPFETYDWFNTPFKFKLHEKSELTSDLIRQYGCSVDMEAVYSYYHLCSKDDIFIDMGANIGWHTMYAAALAKSVIAIEADKDNVLLLNENLAANNIQNVTVVNKAIGAQDRQCFLYHSKDNYGNHLVDPVYINDEHTEYGRIDMVTLDSLLSEMIIKDNLDPSKIKLIKMDIQGSEAAAFRGAEGFFASHKPRIVIEYAPFHLKQCGASPFDIFSFIDRYGYRPYIIDQIDVYNPHFKLTPVSLGWLVDKTKELMSTNAYKDLCLIHESDTIL
jgi:FkbM family methyltransferase